MLGHVAQSVGGALPGSSGSAFISQIVRGGSVISETKTATVPAGAAWAFVEVLAHGGQGARSSANMSSGAGAGGNDAIVPSIPGETINFITVRAAGYAGSQGSLSVVIGNNPGVTSNSGTGGTVGSQVFPGGAGKYPGENGKRTTSGASSTILTGGKGGGRLAGDVAISEDADSPLGGIGSGATIGGSSVAGATATSPGLAIVTFFASYEDALSFAKSVYGGVWVP